MDANLQLDPRGGLGPEVVVGIVGAGVMGAGIAQVAALAGHRVLIDDLEASMAKSAIDRIGAWLEKLVKAETVSVERAESARARLRTVDALEEFSRCGLVIEAIVEELEPKRSLYRDLEKIVGKDAILASNTSSISISALGTALERPQRLAGMHFFNPAPVMPLVEIVEGASTSSAVSDLLFATALRWGKTPVRTRSTPGFIVNRVARPFYAEALRLLQEQAAGCATIDALMREAGGFRMGPFELMDLIGNDVNFAVTRSVWDGFYHDPRFTPSHLQWEMVQAGRLGRKSGRGFYCYEPGKANAGPATAEPAPLPSSIQIYGASPAAEALAQRLRAAGAKFERLTAHADARIAQCAPGCVLYLSDGRTASALAASSNIRNTIVMDLALDFRTAARVAVAAAGQAEDSAVLAAAGLLQCARFAVSVIEDVPGLAVMRTVCMLINEAADTVNQGVCSAADLELAMRKGVGYPRGLLEWADAIGVAAVVRILDHLAQWYGEDRYRASPLLRRTALCQTRLMDDISHTTRPGSAPQPGIEDRA
jgi:3-hydroxybutyryl-CoA dehydrogenase